MLGGSVSPSHAWINIIDWGTPINVHGIEVADGDLVHADLHGAVVVPAQDAAAILEEAAKIAARERIIIAAAKQPGFNMDKLRAAWKGMAEIH
jgi:regulator of RNase E activity RraA